MKRKEIYDRAHGKATTNEEITDVRYIDIVYDIHLALKQGIFQYDPHDQNRMMMYRSAGDSEHPEGWYSQNIMDVASELKYDLKQYQKFRKALDERRKEKGLPGLSEIDISDLYEK